MSSSVNERLSKAIRLRIFAQQAVERGDIQAIIEANDLADRAYLEMNGDEQRAYREWIRPLAEQVLRELGDALSALPVYGDA